MSVTGKQVFVTNAVVVPVYSETALHVKGIIVPICHVREPGVMELMSGGGLLGRTGPWVPAIFL